MKRVLEALRGNPHATAQTAGGVAVAAGLVACFGVGIALLVAGVVVLGGSVYLESQKGGK